GSPDRSGQGLRPHPPLGGSRRRLCRDGRTPRHEGHAHPLTRTHHRKDTAMITTDFTDKVAFITGAGVGIGRATALAFAEDEDDLHEPARLVRDTGRRAHPIVADVSDASAVQAAVSSTADEFGRIDFAVNNAGIEQPPTPLDENGQDDWNRLIAVNLTGVFL